MSLLVGLVLALTLFGGLGVVFTRDPRLQVFAMAANGMVLTLLFFTLQAPDVAMAELAVGTAATPLLFVAALASIRAHAKRDDE